MNKALEFLVRLLIGGLSVIIIAYALPDSGVAIANFFSAILVAAVVAFLNGVIKPILVLLTLPLTIFTFGLFLLVINALLILFADAIVPGFQVGGFWWALLFSLILSLLISFFNGLAGIDNKQRSE